MVVTIGASVMKKHKFLAPLAVCVASLPSSTALPARTSSVTAKIIVAAAHGASVTAAADQLVLTRSAGGELRVTDHESHASHESHATHANHMSGS